MFLLSGRHFMRDGAPHLIVSGAMHYSRIHPEQWADRLARLRAMGANTVETYVPWNFHCPARGVTDFTGWRDVGRFLDLAADADLDVIVRPGPYICAEWDAGGLPAWLLTDSGLRLRVHNDAFLCEVDAWLDEVMPIVVERLYPDGGRVVLVQVENEYGSYADDDAYLSHLRDGLVARGVRVPLVTSDGPRLAYLEAGTIEGVLPTVNFGSRSPEVLELFRSEYGESPAMCMEYWNGWFDHWGEAHHTRSAADAATELATMLDNGMSVNIYMAHGGTNFGLWNGSNFADKLQPTVTSYDYDAPISENGALTDKFMAYRDVIARHLPVPDLPADLDIEPPTQPSADLTPVRSGVLTVSAMQDIAVDSLDRVPGLRTQSSSFPPTFEDVGLERGVLLLRHRLRHPGDVVPLRLHGLHDRAHVFLDGRLIGVLERDETDVPALNVEADRGTHDLEIVVESLGRINFGPRLGERKGIVDGVWFGTHFLTGWQATPLALDLAGPQLLALANGGLSEVGEGWSIDQFALPIELPGADAWLDVADQTRGYAFVDDFMVGRYWQRGPQQTLYVPGPLLSGDEACVTLLSTDGQGGALRTSSRPILDVVRTPDTHEDTYYDQH